MSMFSNKDNKAPKTKDEITPEKIKIMLEWIVDIVVSKPLPGKPTVEQLAKKYIQKCDGDIEKACNKVILDATLKTAGFGFITGLPGLFLLPVTLPADLILTYTQQVAMVATIAKMTGHDLDSQEIKAMCLLATCGSSGAAKVLSQVGIKVIETTVETIGTRILLSQLPKMIQGPVSRKLITCIGVQTAAKLTGKSVPVAICKSIPVISGCFGGVINGSSSYAAGNCAKELFLKGDHFIVADSTLVL